MNTRIFFLTAVFSLITSSVFSQKKENENTYKKHFIGSTLFMLANLGENSGNYYQLNYGYRITQKNVISAEAVTWTYKAPLGIPYGPDKENKDTEFPGKVQAYGIGLAYKHFLWRRVYSQIHATAMHQDYLDENNKKIQSGFQLFCTLRFGYQIQFFKGRLFLEPSIAFTSWPINTNLPESFQVEEDKWNKFFLFEPGLHFGITF